MVGGTIQGLFVVVAVVMALTHRRWAPEAAIVVGFGSAIVFTYAHLLPSFWPAYQDSFVSGPHINVTWFSWLSAVDRDRHRHCVRDRWHRHAGRDEARMVCGRKVRTMNRRRNVVLRRSVWNVHSLAGISC